MVKEQKRVKSIRGAAHPRGARARERARIEFQPIHTHPPLPHPKGGNSVIGIDPGITGAIVVTNGLDLVSWPMPVIQIDKERSIDFNGIASILVEVEKSFGSLHVFLERAVPMAMGSKAAFNYGRGFEAVTLAITLQGLPLTLVEPQKWAKEMHQGISQNLKPKARSLIAVKRLYPKLVGLLPVKPKSKVLLDGPVDALLIAGYGLRRLGVTPKIERAVVVSGNGAKVLGPAGGGGTGDDVGDFW